MDTTNHDFIRNYELDTWTRCSESYQDTFAMLTNQTISALIESTNIVSGSRVLDIGCGPGNSTNILSKTGAIVTGIDFSQKMIAIAASNYPALDFKQVDAENIEESENTFDVVIANYVVHHLPNPVQVFSEIARVLKPGGRFAFVVWGAREEQSSIGAFVRAFSAHHELSDLPHGPLYGVTEFEVFNDFIQKGGLHKFELSNHSTIWKSQTLKPIIDGLWAWANLSSFPQEKQARIKTDMIQNCEPFAVNGGYAFPHTAILGTAVK